MYAQKAPILGYFFFVKIDPPKNASNRITQSNVYFLNLLLQQAILLSATQDVNLPQKFNNAQLDLISKTTTYEKILFDAVADVLLIDATLKLVNLKMCKTISVFYENVR